MDAKELELLGADKSKIYYSPSGEIVSIFVKDKWTLFYSAEAYHQSKLPVPSEEVKKIKNRYIDAHCNPDFEGDKFKYIFSTHL